jgi:hypothetical protein
MASNAARSSVHAAGQWWTSSSHSTPEKSRAVALDVLVEPNVGRRHAASKCGVAGWRRRPVRVKRSPHVLGFVIVAIRWVFVDPSPELFSAHAHVRR